MNNILFWVLLENSKNTAQFLTKNKMTKVQITQKYLIRAWWNGSSGRMLA
jgi:hypothetical protein